MHGEIKGNKLILTIDLASEAFQSKSAIAKAIKQGTDPAKVEATMLATSGGFARVGNLKVSYNVTKG